MSLSTLSLTSLALAICGVLAMPAANAQAFDAVRLSAAAPGKDGGAAGSALILGSQYQGSDERRTMVLPLLDYQWANGWFAGVSNGIGYNFSKNSATQYGVRLTADLGRKESRSVALRGMGDIDAAAEVGAFFNYKLQQGITLTSSARYGSGQNNDGLVVDVGAAYSAPINAQLRWNAGAAVTLANADYMQSFFGVSALQSSQSGYAAYTPKAGVRDARVSLGLTYSLNPRTSITGILSVNTLMGDAAKSPMVKTKTTATGVIAVAYAF